MVMLVMAMDDHDQAHHRMIIIMPIAIITIIMPIAIITIIITT